MRRTLVTIALVCTAASPPSAAGIPSPRLSIPELIRTSDVVLTGTVATVAVGIDRDAPYAYVALDVGEVFKGWIPERRIILKQADGEASFGARERVLVFLQVRPGDRTLHTAALSQGKWTIAADAGTGAPIARRSTGDAARRTALGTPLETISLAALAAAVSSSGATTSPDSSRADIAVQPRDAAAAVAVDTAAPAEPRQLAVTVTVAGATATVDLTWLPPSSGGAPASYLVEAGSAPGLSDLASVSNGAATSLRAPVPLGFTAFVRVRAVNGAGVSPPSNEVRVSAAPPVAPGPPSRLDVNIARGGVKLMWSAPSTGLPVTYLLEAGSSSGATNIATVATGSSETLFFGLAPVGNYFVRVRAQNSAGVGPPSNEVFFSSPGSGTCIPPQAPPTDVVASVSGSTLTLSFTRVELFATSYVVQAGTTSGTSDIATVDIGSFVPAIITDVPPGTYYLRVRGRDNRCGVGPASSEVTITVR